MYLQNSIYLDVPINLCETIGPLKKYYKLAVWQKEFWEKRNNVMGQNILKFVPKYKRIVVLTGNMHKYYLESGLKREKGNFVLTQFWDY